MFWKQLVIKINACFGEGAFQCLPVGKFLGKAKICYFEMPLLVEQQVFRLQISVNNVLGVQVLERAHYLCWVKAGGFWGESTSVSQVRKKLAAAHVLQEHVESVVVMMTPISGKCQDSLFYIDSISRERKNISLANWPLLTFFSKNRHSHVTLRPLSRLRVKYFCYSQESI